MAFVFALLGSALSALLAFLATLALLQCAALGLLVAFVCGSSSSLPSRASLRRGLIATLRVLACAIAALSAQPARSRRTSSRRRRTSRERHQRSTASTEAALLVSRALGPTRLAPLSPDSLHLDGAEGSTSCGCLRGVGTLGKRRASDQALLAGGLVRIRTLRRNSAGSCADLRDEFVREASELARQAQSRAKVERHVERMEARWAQSRLGGSASGAPSGAVHVGHVSRSAMDGPSAEQLMRARDRVRKSVQASLAEVEKHRRSSSAYEAPEGSKQVRERAAGREGGMPPSVSLLSPSGHVELYEGGGGTQSPLLVNLLRRRAEERRPIQRCPPSKPRLGRAKEMPLFKQMMQQRAGALMAAGRAQFMARQEQEREAYMDSLMNQIVPPVSASEPRARKEQEKERERKQAILRQVLAMECGGHGSEVSGNSEVEAVWLMVLEMEQKYSDYEDQQARELFESQLTGFGVFV